MIKMISLFATLAGRAATIMRSNKGNSCNASNDLNKRKDYVSG